MQNVICRTGHAPAHTGTNQEVVMRRFNMVAVRAAGTMLGVLPPPAGSTAAWADGPQHVKSTFPFDPPPLPAGAFCNFTYGEAATVSLNAIIFANSEIGRA